MIHAEIPMAVRNVAIKSRRMVRPQLRMAEPTTYPTQAMASQKRAVTAFWVSSGYAEMDTSQPCRLRTHVLTGA